MKKPLRRCLFLAAFTLLAGAGLSALRADAPAPQPAADNKPAGDRALADRLWVLGSNLAEESANPLWRWKLSAPIFQAVYRLNPDNPVYLRGLLNRLSALNKVQDTNALQLEIAEHLRKLDPDDQGAQQRVIALNVSLCENNSDKIAYLRQIIPSERVPAAVRSFAAVRLAENLKERSNDQAIAALDDALRLNPLNIEAIGTRLGTLGPDADPAQRMMLLLNLVRAAPKQTTALLEAANLLAEAALPDTALELYGRLFKIAGDNRWAIEPDWLQRYAIVAFVDDKQKVAQDACDSIIGANPVRYESLIIRLLQEKQSKAPTSDDVKSLVDRAWTALTIELGAIRAQMAGKAPTTLPTTSPATAGPLSLSADTALLKALPPDKAPLRAAYMTAIREAVWFQLHIARDLPAARALLAELKPMVPDADVAVATLEGWLYFEEGKVGEAKVKFSAIADKDVFGQLGLILLMPAGAERDAAASRLASRCRTDMAAVYVADALRAMKPVLIPSAAAPRLKSIYEAFPSKLLKALFQPQNFYLLKAEGVRQSFAFDEPIMVRVTLQNISDADIAIDDGAFVNPVFCIEASIPQASDKPGVIHTDRFSSTPLLHPRESLVQEFRIDNKVQRPLWGLPAAPVSIMLSVRTNPVEREKDTISDLCGFSIQFTKPIERAAYPFDADHIAKLIDRAASDDPVVRLGAVNQVAAFVPFVAKRMQAAPADEPLKAMMGKLGDSLRKAIVDEDPAVRAWAKYEYTFMLGESERPKHVQDMVNDADWRCRLMGIYVAAEIDMKTAPEIAKAAQARETDPLVKQFAGAWVEYHQAAATQPSTRPATGPATDPAR